MKWFKRNAEHNAPEDPVVIGYAEHEAEVGEPVEIQLSEPVEIQPSEPVEIQPSEPEPKPTKPSRKRAKFGTENRLHSYHGNVFIGHFSGQIELVSRDEEWRSVRELAEAIDTPNIEAVKVCLSHMVKVGYMQADDQGRYRHAKDRPKGEKGARQRKRAERRLTANGSGKLSPRKAKDRATILADLLEHPAGVRRTVLVELVDQNVGRALDWMVVADEVELVKKKGGEVWRLTVKGREAAILSQLESAPVYGSKVQVPGSAVKPGDFV